jgi:hypothetical protein
MSSHAGWIVGLAIAGIGCGAAMLRPDGGDGGGGDSGQIEGGGGDAPPVACAAGGVCPAGTACGPGNLCVDCAAITAMLPAAPVLKRPMRGAYTGSLHAPPAMATRRPKFSWAAVAPTCGAVSYQVQADDSCSPGALDGCAFPSPELDATGIAATSHAPAQDLPVATTPPVGALYAWRNRACDASARCGAWSEVRYLHVGRVREDINGDGYGDLLAGSNRGTEVYFGASQFNTSDASRTIPTASGAPTSFVGDVNGDGYGDLFGTTIYTPTSGQAPTLYFGGPDVTALATLILTKTAGGPSTLMQTTPAGDMNGDGFADVIVQWGYGSTTPMTELRIFFGGSAIANTPDRSIPGPYVGFFTLQDSGRLGDLNGDGFDDIALAAVTDAGTNVGLVQLFVGASSPTATAVSVPVAGGSYQIEPAGDVDGDGFDDAVIIIAGTSYALYRGAGQLPTLGAMTWPDTTTSSAAGGFDLDEDGFSDFVIGTTATAILYRGGPTGPSVVPNGLSRLVGARIVAFSDHDGDGRSDFVGMDPSTSPASISWAGSDGTTNPRSFIVRLPTGAMFNSRLVR